MELDIEMASLALNEKKRRISTVIEASQDEETLRQPDATTALRRSNRKRIRPLDVEKRRVYTKPKKFNGKTDKEISGYYLNKKVKLLHTSLETIFEEPKNSEVVMSGRKLRRIINFSVNSAEKLKTKKRAMKAKKVCAVKSRRSKKISKELFLQRMKELDLVQET